MKNLSLIMVLLLLYSGFTNAESSANPYVLTDLEKANNALARVMGRVEPHVAPVVMYNVSGDTSVTHGEKKVTQHNYRTSIIRNSDWSKE